MSSPNYPAEQLLTRALTSLRAGDLAEAEIGFQQVLSHDPANPAALHQLAMLAYDRGDRPTARELLARALTSSPEDLRILIPYGQLLHELSEPREALDIFLRILALDNQLSDVWNAAGICLQETGQSAQAVEFYLHAVGLNPDYPEALNNLGVILTNEGDPVAAIDHFQQAIALKPDYPHSHANLGAAFRNHLDYPSSLAAFREAHRLQPNDPDIAGAYGELLSLLYDPQAQALLQQAVDLRPGNPEKHWNLAIELLKRGDYLNGWREYEWRWLRARNHKPMPDLGKPLWRNHPGEHLAGSTILLHAEQGYGDTLQFLRYVPLLLAQDANVLLLIQPPLFRLAQDFAAQFPGRVRALSETDAKPHFDWHIPLMSLPHAFATTLETTPPPLRFTAPATPLISTGSPRRIGIAWSGNPLHERDRERSIPFAALAPLFALPNIEWTSLQLGPAASQLASANLPIAQPHLADFLDTANLLDTLDLVLTVDTALAHLAASQGIPTWILLPYIADWRWLRPETLTNHWYPKARIFRQPALPPNQTQLDLWRPVIAELTRTLSLPAVP